jgi:hypothetical protein
VILQRNLWSIFMTSLLSLPVVFIAVPGAQAEPKTAIADDGREVRLKDNGVWEYVTDDVFATTSDGQRIRLKSNQRGQKVRDGEAPAYQPVPISTVERDNATVADVSLILDQVHIENQREDIRKNTRLRSNIVFYIEVNSDDLIDRLTPDQFVAQDSKGKAYPVFSVEQGAAPIGGQPRIVVRAKGAPRWWGVKFFSLQIAPNAIGNPDTIDLRKPMRDVLKKEVQELPGDDL